MGSEDVVHVLFECSLAKLVWEFMGLANWVQGMPHETIMDIFKRLFTTGSREQRVLIAVLCWNIWNRRNKWVWNKVRHVSNWD